MKESSQVGDVSDTEDIPSQVRIPWRVCGETVERHDATPKVDDGEINL
jgi:hypothetical protein